MTALTIILLVLVVLLYAKWIAIALMLPCMVADRRRHTEPRWYWQLLAIPNRAMSKFSNCGWERYVLFQVAYLPSVHLRKAVYRALGAQLEPRVVFHVGTEIRSPQGLKIGGGTIVGDFALLDAHKGLVMGRNVNISSHVSIYTGQHDHRSPTFASSQKRSVTIGDRVWLGANVIVLPGVTIGEGAVCCAGCVVTKDVEPFAVVAGIPAQKVGERPRVLTYEFDGSSCRFY